MKTISTLSALIISILLSLSSNSQTTYVNSGSSTNYNLGNGDSLYIKSGTYTGTISSFNQNAKITVAAAAGFQPASFSNPKGKLIVLGSAKFSTLKSSKNFDLENYGVTEITGITQMNGGVQKWNNYFGATLKFTGAVSMNSNATMINDGTVTAASSFTMNTSAAFTNRNMVTISGAFTNNSGNLINLGKLEAASITFNSTSTFTNNCRLVVNGSITISSTFINDGLIWIPAQYTSASLTNYGTINNTADGKVKVKNFSNYGTLTGKGSYYFTGTTYNSGTVGVSGTTSDTIKIFDASRTSPSTIFDNQSGTIRPNAKFASFPAPDTTFPYTSCAMQYKSMMYVLPVKWNYFFVNLSDNTPVISWSSEQDAGTSFQVERSYDAVNFSSISSVASAASTTNYQYEDRQVNTQAAIVYYRVKAIEPGGDQKLSETKAVRFSNKQGVSIQITPNPFTSQFSINYQSSERGMIIIKVYSMSGRLQATKTASVSKGFNSISVTEASTLAKGFYMVQLISNNNLIASEKIVKQ